MTKRDAWFILLGIALVSCAGASYTYYNLEIPDGCYSQGKLLAHLAQDDKPLTICQPDASNKMKCAVFTEDEKTRLFTDYDKCIADLKACQSALH
jgi:hypothetical protein